MNLIDEIVYGDDKLHVSFGDQLLIECDYNKIYGLGERYNSINHKGEEIVNVVEEAFCNQGDKTYFPLPFFLLDNGYAFFIDTKEMISYDFGSSIIISHINPTLDKIHIFKGSYKECINDFLRLTGDAMKAPKWTFGPWISAHRWNSQEIINGVRKQLKDLYIPVTVLVIEQWSDEATFYIFNGAKYPDKKVLQYEDFSYDNSPWYDPKAMIDGLHEEGIKVLLWQCPMVKHIPEDEPYNERHSKDWAYAKENRLVVEGQGDSYTIPDGKWFKRSLIPDFTNESTNKWWFDNRQYLLDIGVDGFKTDGGEFIYGEVENSVGENMNQLKNNYPLEYVKAYREFLGDDRVAFSRAGYLGQQQYTLQWAGDQKSTFSELLSMYNAGISASLCGQINWGFDIGGFSGELPSLDLYYRANQLAVFSPIMQVHSEPVGGQFSATDPIRAFNNERTPWNMAKEDGNVLEDIRHLYNLRMNLLPYIYSEYLKALENKTTLMKHMNIDHVGNYPEDQFKFGDLIVAPILYDMESSSVEGREIILPEGHYYNIFTKELCCNITKLKDVSLTDMYVFAKEGSAVVTMSNTLIPDRISNDVDSTSIFFRLYGQVGAYRYLDDTNDFIIQWSNLEVTFIGNPTIEIQWEIISEDSL